MHKQVGKTAVQTRYRADIDGLRAVAVLPVMFFHAGIGPFSGGFVGVDVFFVISGFLITSLLLKDLETGSFSIAHFYERRARRILPALTAMLLAVTFAACIIYPPTQLAAFGERLFATALFYANIHFWQIADYFAPQASELELLHVWSLAVEEQFYLFFPPLLWAAWRWTSRRMLVALIGAATLISFALAVYGVAKMPLAAFYFLPFRAWELALGALLALGVMPALSLRAAQALALLGVALLAVANLAISEATPFPGWAAALPCLGAALVIYAGQHHAGTLVGRLLSTRPMVGVGQISYSLYLWHWPLLVMPALYWGRPLTTGEAWVTVFVSLLLAWLSWKYVEAPFRRRGKGRPSSRGPLLVAGATVAGLAALGVALSASGGLPSRVSPQVRAIEQSAREGLETFRREDEGVCLDPSGREVCAPRGIPVVVWGDSHAIQHHDGIRAAAGRPIARYGLGGCPPLIGVNFVIASPKRPDVPVPGAWEQAARCRELNDASLRAILARGDVETVVLGGAWQFFTDGSKLVTGQGRYATDTVGGPLSLERSRATLRAGMERTIAALRARGIKVLIMGDTPEYRFHPPRCMAEALMFGRGLEACTLDGAAALARLATSDAMITELARQPGVYAFRPSDYLCREGRCPLTMGSMLLYMDADHVTPEASVALSRHIDPAAFGPAVSRPPGPSGPASQN